MKQRTRSMLVPALVLATCSMPVVATTCYDPNLGTCKDSSQKPPNCTYNTTGCASYEACPCDQTCAGGPNGSWVSCSVISVTRSTHVYGSGATNGAGCCQGGLFIELSATNTCTYDKAFMGDGYCAVPGGIQ